MRKAYIGIDGGGTKTRTLVATADGQLLADLTTPGSNINHHGFAGTQKILGDLFAQIRGLLPAGVEAEALFLGMAGVDREQERKQMGEWVREQWPNARSRVENDAVTALAAGTGRQEGLVLIAGTGSIAFGRDSEGRAGRVGGYGYLIGDEGSGYDIGKRALTAVLQAFDGRGAATILTEKVLAHFGIAHPEELIPVVYAGEFTRDGMARVARLVFAAAGEGDAISLGLLDGAADALGEMVNVLLEKLHFSDGPVSLALTGGLFHPGSLLTERVQSRLDARVQASASERPPVTGALLLAHELGGGARTESFSTLLSSVR